MKVWQSRSAAAAVCALLGELAWAQSAPGAATLPAVTVRGAIASENYAVQEATTATKTDTPILQTPASVQVIPRAVLEDKQSMSLPDAINGHVSGVLGRTGGGFLYDNFIIRGFSGSGFGDAYRNGLYNRQDIYDLSNIEQIEVLKGPAAVLYGRIEPGGLVNYVTKKALNQPYYALQQQVGSDHQFRTSVDATGPLDKGRTLLYRLNASYTDNDSFRDFVGNERFFVAPTLTWRPNQRFEVNVELEHKRDRFQADYGIPAVGNRPAAIPLTRNLSDGPKRQSIQNTLVAFDWTYRFNDDWQIKHRYHQQDWTFDAQQVLAGNVQADNRTQNRNLLFSTQDVKTQATNLDLTGKFNLFGARHSLLMGVDAFYATTEARQLFTAAPTIDIFNPVYGLINWGALAKNNNFYRKERWSGFYLQDQITVFEKLHILIGGRYDSVQTGAIASPVSMEAARAARIERSDDQISPRFGLLYQVQPWLSTYVSYTESFGGNNGVSASGTPFEPQRGKQYEVGFKTESADKRFSSTVAVFDLTRSNLLTADLNNPGFQILAGEAKSKGLEVDVAGHATDKLKLLATYAYTDAKYVRDNGTLLGKRLENSPMHQGSLWGTYQVNGAFKLGLGGVAVGMRQGDSLNTYQLPGYGRIDAMASYTQRMGKHRLTLQLNVNNVLDKDYYANSSGGRPTIIPGAPRGFLGSLKYEY
jgi:iron complex outermembrane recepter protein